MGENELSRKRVKFMSKGELEAVADQQWVPVKLVGGAKLKWMRGIPDNRNICSQCHK